MHRSRLGATGPVSSGIGLGCLGIAGAYGRSDPDEAIGLVRHALDSGVTLLDTADHSTHGDGRRIVGRAIAGRRDDALIAAHAWPTSGVGGVGGVTDNPVNAARQCEATLQRLGTDHLDLYYLHPGGTDAPIEDQIGALAELVESGKVRHLGLYDATSSQLRRAHATHPIAALAVEYSLWARQVEKDRLPLARELGIGTVACGPLGRGLLTGRPVSAERLDINDLRRLDPRFALARLPAYRPLVRELEKTAADLDIGVSRLALAWLLSRGEDIVPIPGTRDRIHLEMNLLSLGVGLAADVADRLTEIFPDGGAAADVDGSEG
jgi:aryl-alcohol dehydrogenase-like predicted oxidoreductase